RRRTAWPARSRRWCRDCVGWTSTRCPAWPGRSTGHARWPRWARRGSTPRSSAPRWAQRSSTRRTWSACASRCRRSSRRPSVPETAVDLLPRLGAFARLLHAAGLEAGPRRLTDATRALAFVDLKQQYDFRNALRAVFVSRREDIPIFEAAFDIFWAPPDPRARAGVIPVRSRSLPLSPERAQAWANALGLNTSQLNRDQDNTEFAARSSGYSAQELLRQKDFEEMTWAETEQVRHLLEQAPWRVAERKTRRLRPSRSGGIDLRRSARHAIRSSGELMTLFRR